MTDEERQEIKKLAVGAWLVWGWVLKTSDTETTLQNPLSEKHEIYDITGIKEIAGMVTKRLQALGNKDPEQPGELN